MPRKLIMCGDHPVLAFEYEPASGRACSSGEVLDPRRLPLEFTTHGKSALYARRIDEWWKSRAIPSTRDGIRRVLDSLGANGTMHRICSLLLSLRRFQLQEAHQDDSFLPREEMTVLKDASAVLNMRCLQSKLIS